MKYFLTALRSSPSIYKIQMWRFVISIKMVYLFDVKVDDYSRFDMGITLTNLHIFAELRGRKSFPEAPS